MSAEPGGSVRECMTGLQGSEASQTLTIIAMENLSPVTRFSNFFLCEETHLKSRFSYEATSFSILSQIILNAV